MALQLFIDKSAVSACIKTSFGSVGAFASEWKADHPDDARSASTIYDWMKAGIPSTEHAIFSFFRMLDLDPCAAVDHERTGIEQRFKQIRRSILLGGDRFPQIRSLVDMIWPDDNWPNSVSAEEYFGRTWCCRDFEHIAEVKNKYATVTIVQAEHENPEDAPRAYYVAFRDDEGDDELWRPYGIAVRRSGINYVLNSKGKILSEPSKHNTALRFQTYFGGGRASFRVASLHGFNLMKRFPDDRVLDLRFP